MSPECNPRFFPHQDNSDVQNLSIPLLNIAVLTYFSATQNHLLDFLSDAYFPETATISGWAESFNCGLGIQRDLPPHRAIAVNPRETPGLQKGQNYAENDQNDSSE